MKSRTLITALAVALLPAPAFAGAIVSGFDTTSFAANDDGYTDAINLGFSANFFGNTYTDTFVSNNGYVTFDTGQSDFTPTGLGAGYSGQPIIAPFFADVDTRGTDSELTKYGSGMVDGHTAFGTTWKNVGYYDSNSDKLNSFQVLLVDRSDIASGDFDIYFNYDKILWETGDVDGGTDGLGGNSAAVGYNAGTGNAAGTYGQLTGSLVNGALLDGGADSLVAGSNIGVAGRYLFNVRNGNVAPPPPPQSAVPEPASWALMIIGFGAVGFASRRRQKQRTTLSFA